MYSAIIHYRVQQNWMVILLLLVSFMISNTDNVGISLIDLLLKLVGRYKSLPAAFLFWIYYKNHIFDAEMSLGSSLRGATIGMVVTKNGTPPPLPAEHDNFFSNQMDQPYHDTATGKIVFQHQKLVGLFEELLNLYNTYCDWTLLLPTEIGMQHYYQSH